MKEIFDIIGDIHGHADALEQLLQKLGYHRKGGVYSHPQGRKVIFVGDFIDRGPKIREALHLVKDMCDSGNAEAVMGNHEFNAICFHKPHEESGGFFRNHNYAEISQHLETLKQFNQFKSEWETFLSWFEKLPLWIDKDDFRVVHAYWDDEHIKYLDQCGTLMSADFLEKATNKKQKPKEYTAVEAILKGIEEELPEGVCFNDKDGIIRHECRIKWWAPSAQLKTMDDYLVACPEEIKTVPLNDAQKSKYIYNDSKPVFFGHYWLKGIPQVENGKAICLDYSIAKGGKSVAYSTDTGTLTYV